MQAREDIPPDGGSEPQVEAPSLSEPAFQAGPVTDSDAPVDDLPPDDTASLEPGQRVPETRQQSAPRAIKIYTRAGDDGSTGLFGGGRVSKSDGRIDCYGTVDELNACLGFVAAAAGTDHADLVELSLSCRPSLFTIGSHLATPGNSPHRDKLPSLEVSIVERLEREIDDAEAELPPLRQFILPGGTEVASRLHLARTVCRRAERLLVAAMPNLSISPPALAYLNRLSDWLFVQARLANFRVSVPDVPWGNK